MICSDWRNSRNYPILTKKEEVTVLKKWQQDRDSASLERLVSSHLRLIVAEAVRLRRYVESLDDLVSEGVVAFVAALGKFDLARGTRVSSYVIPWIRSALREYVLRTSSLVTHGVGKREKKIFFMLPYLRAKGSTQEGMDVAVEREFGAGKYIAFLISAFKAPISLESSCREDDDAFVLEQDLTIDEMDIIEPIDDRKRMELLVRAMKCLTPREKSVVEMRFLSHQRKPLCVIGKEMGISTERVRQLEKAALERLSRNVRLSFFEDRERSDDGCVQADRLVEGIAAEPTPVCLGMRNEL